MTVHRLTKAQARQIAVCAQMLDAPRPTELLEVVHRLTLLQIDPTAAIAPIDPAVPSLAAFFKKSRLCSIASVHIKNTAGASSGG